MITSMTGFAKTSETNTFGSIDCEVRSVNHRYLEVYVRLPESFRSLETAVRSLVQKRVKRGKVEVSFQFSSSANQAAFAVDESTLAGLGKAIDAVRSALPEATISALEVLRWNGVMKTGAINTDELSAAFLALLEKTVTQFIAVREREGSALKEGMLVQCDQMIAESDKIKARLPLMLAYEKKRILERFSELSLTVDSDRLEQEMVWIMQKADIAEELQRLTVHIAEVRRVLTKDDIVGRRLDFLMQELNREVNTMASKSLDVETTQSTIEMKVLIEQMREQVQNLE